MYPLWVNIALMQYWINFTQYQWDVFTQCQCYGFNFTQYPWVENYPAEGFSSSNPTVM